MNLLRAILIAGLACTLTAQDIDISGDWTADVAESLTANYPTQKAAHPELPELEVLLRASKENPQNERIIIDADKITKVIGPMKVVCTVLDAWTESDSRHLKTRIVDGIGSERFQTFILRRDRERLLSYELVNNALLVKVFYKTALDGGAEAVIAFIDGSVRALETSFQAGGYDDDDGNRIGSYSFDPLLLSFAAQGDPKYERFMHDIGATRRRMALHAYRSVINDGWTVEISPNGANGNPAETGYRVRVAKNGIAYVGTNDAPAALEPKAPAKD
jgi:hypothetical protein